MGDAKGSSDTLVTEATYVGKSTSKNDLVQSESGSDRSSNDIHAEAHQKKKTRLLVIIGICVTIAVVVAITVPLVVLGGDDDADPTRTTTTTTTVSTPTPGIRDLTATTTFGDVVGHYVPLMNALGQNKTLVSFNSIPFAKPPVGNLRWTKPVDPDPWSMPMIADTLPPLCIQRNLSIQRTHFGWDRFSEDCLYLNVLTPLDNSRDPYPVMVYIHGGSYQSNGAIKFPAHFLAEKDVVTVVIQYRVGIMGFASTDQPDQFSNFGLWDQIKALKWVQDNVRAFGGDPDQVTVAGNSAGSSSIGILTVSPEAEGLFRRAIMQSGSEVSVWAVNSPAAEPETFMRYVAEQNGCPAHDNDAMITCLKGIDADVLRMSGTNCSFCLGFVPVVDGVLLPEMPRQLRQQGKGMAVDLMAGNNADECNIFLPVVWPPIIFRPVNQSMFDDAVKMMVGWLTFVVDEDRQPDIVEALKMLYRPWPQIDHGILNKMHIGDICSDAGFHAPTYENLFFNAHHPGTKTFAYLNNVEFFSRIHIVPPWFGVAHMWELPYIFGYPQLQSQFRENEALAKDTGNLNNPLFQYNREDELWSEYIITLWTNFIKYGDPTPSPIQPPNMDHATTWEPYTNEKMEYFYMDNEHAATYLNNYRPKEAAMWNNYFPHLAWDTPMHRMANWEPPAGDGKSRVMKQSPLGFDLGEAFDLSLIDQLIIDAKLKEENENL